MVNVVVAQPGGIVEHALGEEGGGQRNLYAGEIPPLVRDTRKRKRVKPIMRKISDQKYGTHRRFTTGAITEE